MSEKKENKAPKMNLMSWILERRALSLALLILVLCVIMTLTTDTFLRSENIFNILRQATITIILATGMTFIISGGGIDLSVANIMSLACVMSAIVYNHTGMLPNWARDLCCILTASAIGVAAGIA
ncbi:MAG: ABC transporter permease, partial [Clostridia bacterium]|nr:ABC transporter permease [Clostridia bacterium]